MNLPEPARGATRPFLMGMLLLALLCAPARGANLSGRTLRLGVPESLAESGLMTMLAKGFADKTGIPLEWTVDIPGSLFQSFSGCHVDATISNIPEDELAFMRRGNGLLWQAMFYNHFILAGPRGNPANIPASSLFEAMNTIALKKIPFISANNESETRAAEHFIWKILGKEEPSAEAGHIHINAEAPDILPAAAENAAYVLTTDWHWKIYQDALHGADPPLELIVDNDPLLHNQYNLVAASPELCPQAGLDLAEAFAAWIAGPEAQCSIAAFLYNGENTVHPMTPDCGLGR